MEKSSKLLQWELKPSELTFPLFSIGSFLNVRWEFKPEAPEVQPTCQHIPFHGGKGSFDPFSESGERLAGQELLSCLITDNVDMQLICFKGLSSRATLRANRSSLLGQTVEVRVDGEACQTLNLLQASIDFFSLLTKTENQYFDCALGVDVVRETDEKRWHVIKLIMCWCTVAYSSNDTHLLLTVMEVFTSLLTVAANRLKTLVTSDCLCGLMAAVTKYHHTVIVVGSTQFYWWPWYKQCTAAV